MSFSLVPHIGVVCADPLLSWKLREASMQGQGHAIKSTAAFYGHVR